MYGLTLIGLRLFITKKSMFCEHTESWLGGKTNEKGNLLLAGS
jgi:hypothetical protein